MSSYRTIKPVATRTPKKSTGKYESSRREDGGMNKTKVTARRDFSMKLW